MPWYANKAEIRDYLAEMNRDQKVKQQYHKRCAD